MKVRTRLLLPLSAAVLLASCATTDDRGRMTAGYDARMVTDGQYVAQVEELAARRGVKVQWVNPPKVRIEE